MKNILLIEPNFPIPKKSKNHKDFLPVGLLKIGAFLISNGDNVILYRGIPNTIEDRLHLINYNPTEIWITSLFTYWAPHVKFAVGKYRRLFPRAKLVVGGIFASLFTNKEIIEFTECDEVFQGTMIEAEEYLPNYALLPNGDQIDYQILHTSRGCERRCPFCGTWKIEKTFTSIESIIGKVFKKKLVFYDNNFLKNPNVEKILNELIMLNKKREIEWCESQSGFDGRILMEKPHLGKLIKKEGFRNVRIAWDWRMNENKSIKRQIDILHHSGYPYKDIFVFMLYDWDISFDEMEKKRKKCFQWGVQISDCRFRPLTQLFDNYNARKVQTSADYYIHEKMGWSDQLVKQFRKNVRRQNICIRQGVDLYVSDFEHKKVPKDFISDVKKIKSIKEKKDLLKKNNISYWDPRRKCAPLKGKIR